MKKLFIILGVLCALALGGGVSTYLKASSVPGAYVRAEKTYDGKFWVQLVNNSEYSVVGYCPIEGYRNGEWLSITDVVLEASPHTCDEEVVTYNASYWRDVRLHPDYRVVRKY